MQRNLAVQAASTIHAGHLTRRIRIMLLSALVMAIMTGGAAQAQSGAEPNARVRQACKADVYALCAGVMPGGGRIKQCMLEKRDQLSEECRSALVAARNAPGK